MVAPFFIITLALDDNAFKTPIMKPFYTCTPVSGGKSSAYIADNYPSDILLFALVRTDSEKLKYPDSVLRSRVSRRIGADFVGTLEDDTIIHTMFDLEQHIGQHIHWVTGETFDQLIARKKFLPNRFARFCTVEMKIKPMVMFLREYGVVTENIGYRKGEDRRAESMMNRLEDGLLKFNRKAFAVPAFPLIEDGVTKVQVEEYWKDKPVRFAEVSNCVGCFHKSVGMLRRQFDAFPAKMNWFVEKEEEKGKPWKREVSYSTIKKSGLQLTLDDLSGCDSGFCGI